MDMKMVVSLKSYPFILIIGEILHITRVQLIQLLAEIIHQAQLHGQNLMITLVIQQRKIRFLAELFFKIKL